MHIRNLTNSNIFFLVITLSTLFSACAPDERKRADQSLIIKIDKVRDEENKERLLNTTRSLVKDYYKYGINNNINKVKKLFSKKDGSQDYIESNSSKVGAMFSPMKQYSSIRVNLPFLKWGEYYFPYFELVNDKGDNAISLESLLCENVCKLSLFNWAHLKKMGKYNNGSFFSTLFNMHLDKLSIEDRIVKSHEKSVEVCGYPPVGEKINPLCLGLLINRKGIERKSQVPESISKFKSLVRAIRKPEESSYKLGSLISLDDDRGFNFYNIYGLNKINQGKMDVGDIPYLMRLDGKELVSKIRSAQRVQPLGFSKYKGYAIVAYVFLSENGEAIVQYIPFEYADGIFKMPVKSANLAVRVTSIYKFINKTQSKFSRTINKFESMTTHKGSRVKVGNR